MNFIKRGFLEIIRKKGRSFILFAVVFILGNLIASAISIQHATSKVETNIKEKLGAAATIEIDYEFLDSLNETEQMEADIQNIDVDLIKQIGEISYVKYYDYSMPGYAQSEVIESYQDEAMEIDYDDGMFINYFDLKGINYPLVIDFEENKGKLVDGRVFTQEEIDTGASVAIISKKLAEKNDLHVGDVLPLQNENYEYDAAGEEELVLSRDFTLEIIGLFESQSMKNDAEDLASSMIDVDYLNTIYVSNEIVAREDKYLWEAYMEMDEDYAAMMEEEEAYEYYHPLFILKNPKDTEAFEKEVAPLLPEFYTVISAIDYYDSIAGPVESMTKLSKDVLVGAVIATVLIIGLVILLFLRDRKHELGIYLSLGEKRGRVIGQLLIEIIVVAFIGITISLFSGNLLASQVSGQLMAADDYDPVMQDMMYNNAQSSLTTDDVIDSYEFKLDSTYIISFYIIGLITILLSTIIPLIYTLRLNPKKVLM